MKDIQKIQEFFSKPLNEDNINFSDLVGKRFDITIGSGTTGGKWDAEELKNEIKSGLQHYLFDADFAYNWTNNSSEYRSVFKKDTLDPMMGKIDKTLNDMFEFKNGKLTFKFEDEYRKIIDNWFKTNKSISNELRNDYYQYREKYAGVKLNSMLSEAKTGVDMAKKQLDALGVKYEMSKTDKVRPFKVIYKPVNKSDDFYDKFNKIVDEFNLKGFVKTSMNEALMLDKYEVDFYPSEDNVHAYIEIPSNDPTSEDIIYIKGEGETEKEAFEDLEQNYKTYKRYGLYEAKSEDVVKISMNEALMLDKYEVDFFHTKANVYANIEIPSKNPSFEDDIQIKGTGKTEKEAFEDLKRNYEKYKKTGISEAKSEDVVDTITMDIPLFLRMLEYSREDAEQDLDLHDVTEKANKLGKERGILQTDDYEDIVGATEDAPKGEMKEMDYGSILMRNLMPGADVLEKYANILIKDPKIASASTEQEFRGLLRDKVEKAQWFGGDEVSKTAEYVLSSDNNAGKYSNTISRVFNMVKGKYVNETVNLKASKLSTSEYQKAKKLKDFKASDWKYDSKEDLYTKVNEAELNELEEEVDQRNADSYAYQFMQYFDKMSGIVRHNFGDDTRKEFERLVKDKFSKYIVNEGNLGHAEIKNVEKNLSPAQKEELAKLIKSGKIKTSKDLKNWQSSKKESVDETTDYMKRRQKDLEENVAPNHDGKAAPFGSGYKPLEERISEALNKINEELCPAGKAYIKRRQAAGEKSSAYLSGRAVKVCKGQMSGKAKKKTNESLINEGQKINQNLNNLLNKIKKDFNIDNEQI